MTALSILNMNHTLALRETQAPLPVIDPEAEPCHYWHVERKAKRGNRWIFMRDFTGTKSEAATLFLRYFTGTAIKFRLRHVMSYQKVTMK